MVEFRTKVSIRFSIGVRIRLMVRVRFRIKFRLGSESVRFRIRFRLGSGSESGLGIVSESGSGSGSGLGSGSELGMRVMNRLILRVCPHRESLPWCHPATDALAGAARPRWPTSEDTHRLISAVFKPHVHSTLDLLATLVSSKCSWGLWKKE